MNVLVVNQSSVRQPRQFISRWIHAVEKELLRKKVIQKSHCKMDLTLVFLDIKAAKKMNFEFRQKNYATDVLSFDSIETGSLGELVMCPQVLRRQAIENGHSYQVEIGYMILHGILHLLGYDHEISEKEAKIMFEIQDTVFEKLLSEKV